MEANKYLFSILSPGGVQTLDEVGRVPEEECVAGGSRDHGEHGQPHVGEGLRGEPSVPDAQHVRHGLEERPRVLLEPESLLKHRMRNSVRDGKCVNGQSG